MALPHLPLVSSMMGQTHHPMGPSNLGTSTLVDQQTALTSTDHPNPDMLLALIARNKALEGESLIAPPVYTRYEYLTHIFPG